MRTLYFLIAMSCFIIGGCQKNSTWYSVSFKNSSGTNLHDGKVLGWRGVLGPSGYFGGLTLPVPDEITITWKSPIVGKENDAQKHLEQIEQKLDKYFKENLGEGKELALPEYESFPSALFKSHKVVLVLKNKVPKKPNGDITINYVGNDKFKVNFQRDNGGVTNSDMKKQNVIIEDGVLDLSFSKITDSGLSNLEKLESIEVLNIQGTSISDSGLRNLSLFPNLRAVNLNYLDVTGQGFDSVQSSTIEYLSLEQSSFQNQYLKNLSNIENLNVLILIRTNISNLSGLHSLKKLRILNLSRCPVSDRGIEGISKLESLEQLSLLRTDISDEGIKFLTALKHLKSLRLSETGISDSAVKELSVMPLVFIDLSGTDISDKSIEWIAKFPKLESVNLRVTSISNESLEKLKQQCPKLEISF